MDQSNQYYTASEAQEKLGLTKAKFHKMVRQGLIPKVVLPGMKQGIYPRRDIDALSLSMSVVQDEFIFSRSSPADLVEEMKISIKCFGRSFLAPLSDMIAIQQKSNFTFHSLKVSGHVVSYISMFHLPEVLLNEVLTGRQPMQEITQKEILPFTRLQPFNLYLSALTVDPDLSPHLQHLYAGITIIHFIDLLAKLQANDYQVERLYTVTITREYEQLVQKLGFQLLAGKSLVSNRAAYEYLLDTEGAERLKKLQQRYRSRLHTSF